MNLNELSRKITGQSKQIHVAVMHESFLTSVFEGKKTIESRFSLHKIPPYEKVQPGDMIFMKAGPIVGYFTATWVEYFDLQQYPIKDIQQQYGEAICEDDEFWKAKTTKRYVTLIGISDVHKTQPTIIEKRDRRAWITIEA